MSDPDESQRVGLFRSFAGIGDIIHTLMTEVCAWSHMVNRCRSAIWHNRSRMTRNEAAAEAQRQQAAHPDAKWIATQRNGEWVVARIGLEPAPGATGTAIKPPPPTPHETPQSEIQRVVTQFGIG